MKELETVNAQLTEVLVAKENLEFRQRRVRELVQ